VCQIAWPQAAGFTLSSFAGFTVDPAGNSYVAMKLSASNPPLDLGVPLPGYSTGTAIAKVDPECNLVWAYEFSTSGVSLPLVNIPLNLAADATSSLTVTGAFEGAADFGSGPVEETAVVTGFVLRLGPDGSVVFHKEYPGSTMSIVGVQPDGTSVLVRDYEPGSCTLALVDGSIEYVDAAGCDVDAQAEFSSVFSIVQIDASGAEIAENAFPEGSEIFGLAPSSDSGTVADPLGTILVVDRDTANPVLQAVTLDGGLLWSQPLPGYLVALGPAGVVEDTQASYQVPLTDAPILQLFAYDGGVSWTTPLAPPPDQSSNSDWGTGLTVAMNGTIYVWQNPNGLQVEVVDPQGRLQQLRSWHGGVDMMSVDPNGNLITVATNEGPDGGVSYSLTKLGP
jgi:hypothetical protein